MAKGDVTKYQNGAFGNPGSRKHQVASGAAASINSGEPVGKALGSQYVAALATNKPVVATDYLAGISTTTSTDTASADGTVQVENLVPGEVFLCAPLTAATWNTQTLYNALVGDRVLFDLTSSTYTITATDGATNGLVVENLNIAEVPAKVAFSIRAGASYLA